MTYARDGVRTGFDKRARRRTPRHHVELGAVDDRGIELEERRDGLGGIDAQHRAVQGRRRVVDLGARSAGRDRRADALGRALHRAHDEHAVRIVVALRTGERVEDVAHVRTARHGARREQIGAREDG